MKPHKRPTVEIRRPSREAMNAFVASGTTAPVHQSTSAPVDQTTTRRVDKPAKGIVNRRTKGQLDRVTAYLPLSLGIQLRTTCAARRVELSEAIAAAVRQWLDGLGD